MKLRNKKTDIVLTKYYIRALEGVDADKGNERIVLINDETHDKWVYYTLADFNEEWEDYEEPEVYWFINSCGEVLRNIDASDYIEGEDNTSHKEIGNYFETEEQAEKAVEKLKAWKRLKDKGFKFTGFTHKDRGRMDELEIYCQLGECPENIEDMDDVHLLFGGEE